MADPYRNPPKATEYRVTYVAHGMANTPGADWRPEDPLPVPEGDGWELHSWKIIASSGRMNDLYFLWRRDPQ